MVPDAPPTGSLEVPDQLLHGQEELHDAERSRAPGKCPYTR
jgi:hypothetical protein